MFAELYGYKSESDSLGRNCVGERRLPLTSLIQTANRQLVRQGRIHDFQRPIAERSAPSGLHRKPTGVLAVLHARVQLLTDKEGFVVAIRLHSYCSKQTILRV